MPEIDFVLAWVDGGDPEWIKSKNYYLGNKKVSDARYRDWETLRYWFRAVEKYAPWVRKIHFVTCGQIPEWLNTENEKIHLVNHSDYIPNEYLPTFSSHVIELNFHRIEGLSEHFVYFNDDTYINSKVVPEDFFVDGVPCESAVLDVLVPATTKDDFTHYLCNDAAFINEHFNKKEVIKKNFSKWYSPKYGKKLLKNFYYSPMRKFSAFHNFHLPSSMRKSTFEKVWGIDGELLDNTCQNKFRGKNDVNQYIMSYYNICTGEFIPRSTETGKYYTIKNENTSLYDDILVGKHKLICANDNKEIDFERIKLEFKEVFEKKFPNKSSFEK